jgi:CBS domain-containing protein
MIMFVKDVMTTTVITVLPSASVAEAAKLMLGHHFSGLPVVSAGGVLVGIISEGDFLRRGELGTERKRPRWLEFLESPGKAAGEYSQAYGRKVGEVMTDTVRTTSPDTTLDEIVDTMNRFHVKRLPVVKDGTLVGIVARSDLLRALSLVLSATVTAQIDDATIQETIVAEFAKQAWTSAESIHVAVHDGAVELDGTVFDGRQRLAARVVAENVAGVKSVSDKLIWIEPMSGIIVDAGDEASLT